MLYNYLHIILWEHQGTFGGKVTMRTPGTFQRFDASCKVHSMCQEKINPKQEKYGV